ncbi:cell division protein FtsQ/DivIB, partial [Amnibacterium endophyticum]
PPPRRDDRRAIRRAVRERRRALAAELRRPRPRRLRVVPLVVAGLVVLLVGVPALLAFAPVFTVQRVEVTGAAPDVASSVQQALAGQRGRPIALVEDADVRRAVRGVAAVESVSVVRRPPSVLEVRVVPRTPVLQRRTADGWQRLDASRVVIDAAATRWAGLPVLAGSASPRAYAVAVDAVGAAGERGLRVVRVEAAGPDDVVLVLADGLRVQWGGAEHAAAKAEALAAALPKASLGASEIDVSSPGVVLTR